MVECVSNHPNTRSYGSKSFLFQGSPFSFRFMAPVMLTKGSPSSVIRITYERSTCAFQICTWQNEGILSFLPVTVILTNFLQIVLSTIIFIPSNCMPRQTENNSVAPRIFDAKDPGQQADLEQSALR